jgi:hypothetical protein
VGPGVTARGYRFHSGLMGMSWRWKVVMDAQQQIH